MLILKKNAISHASEAIYLCAKSYILEAIWVTELQERLMEIAHLKYHKHQKACWGQKVLEQASSVIFDQSYVFKPG